MRARRAFADLLLDRERIVSPELQHELYRAWPEIFREKNFDPSRTAMHYGIEYDDG